MGRLLPPAPGKITTPEWGRRTVTPAARPLSLIFSAPTADTLKKSLGRENLNMRYAALILLVAVAPLAHAQSGSSAPDAIDQAIRLIEKAKAAYEKITDYECVLVKREKLGDSLSPNHLIQLKVRTSPFCVSMCWNEPKTCAGQEVCYVAGKHEGKMRVKPAGLLGAVGFVSVDPNDPRVRKTTRHSITQAGIGNVIEMAAKGWPLEKEWGLTEVKVGAFLYAKRKCMRVEMTHPTQADGKFLYHKNVIYFDEETALPIRIENYDWPEKPGQPPELLEVFCYLNLKINPGLADSCFDR
jgi:hypothetical protein